MEGVGPALGDDFLPLEQPWPALLPKRRPHGAGTSSRGYPRNALQKQASLPGSCRWEAEGPEPAVGMEWLQGKLGTCSSLGKGRGGLGSSPQEHQEVALLVPQTQVRHSSGTGVGALKPHTGIYTPLHREGVTLGGCQPAVPYLVHSLTFTLPHLSHQTNIDIKETFNKLQ